MTSNHLLRATISGLLTLVLCFAFPVQTFADTISILGTGKVGGALGTQFAKLGHTIVYGSRDPSAESVQELLAQTHATASATSNLEAAQQGDIIVLALPWAVTEEVVKSLGDLSGKTIIDPTNPIARNEDGGMDHAVETSFGEMIQDWLPEAHVVKAFNALSFATMADPSSAGGLVTIPIAGNDDTAKASVASLIEGIGFEVVDVGPIRFAHEIEGLLVLWINARASGSPFNYYLRPVEGG
jgi:8-hydroxy-5-deazaflavin:NADPH oxidoreductase